MSVPKPVLMLYVAADPAAARLLQSRLNGCGCVVDMARDEKEGLARWESRCYDLLITDHDLPGLTGLDLLRTLATKGPLPAAVMIAGPGDEAAAVEALKIGPVHCVIKDPNARYLHLIPAVVERALEERWVLNENKRVEVELREAQSRYRSLFETAAAGIGFSTADGRVIECNEYLLNNPGEMAGVSRFATMISTS